MKNIYFKIFTTLGLLFCFSANVIFAAQIAKSKIYLNESKPIAAAEKKLNVEEKLSLFNSLPFTEQSFTTYIPAGLKLYSVKLSLPSSHYSIPFLPPKG